MRINVISGCFLSAALFLGLNLNAVADDVKIPQLNFNCTITSPKDLDTLYITVKGMGKPASNSPTAKEKEMAKRAAMADAYRNLARIIGTTVREKQDDTVVERVSGLIKGAKVVSEMTLPDGTIMIELSMPLLEITRPTNDKIDDLNTDLIKYQKQIKELTSKLEKQQKAMELIKKNLDEACK